MWLLQSRGRPQILARFLARAVETGLSTPGHIWIDSDDPTLPEYLSLKLPEGWMIGVHRRIGLGPSTNALLMGYWDEPWFGILGDDAMPATQDWDKKLIAEAGADYMASPADGINDGTARITNGTVIGGNLARSLGWLILPGLQRLYGDDVLHEIGKERGVLRYRPDVRVEHWHFTTGKTPMDETYLKPEASADRSIYEEWQKARMAKNTPITICCINAGNYCERGAEYVNNLYDMVTRNLPEGYPGRFVCFTDDPNDDLHEGIEVRPLPVQGLPGWWNKLALFKKGVFSEGERVMFMDLDTLIVGPLDDIVAYKGQFATLRDFYNPQYVGPAIILWEASKLIYSIWDEWNDQDRPMTGHGDLWWINSLDQGRFAHRADKLQKLYPDKFVSFKAHCKPYPPKGASVVCFHGQPRPHNANVDWVESVWKLGGMTAQQLETVANTSTEETKANIRSSGLLDLPWLDQCAPHDGHAVIVGGGPSLASTLEEIRYRKDIGQTIISLNGTRDYLITNGIVPDWHIVLDARPDNARFVQNPNADTTYFVASQCAPKIFNTLEGQKVIVWHVHTAEILESLPLNDKPVCLIAGGSTVGLNAMGVAYAQGFHMIHLYGFDSSVAENHHAYTQAENDKDNIIDAEAGGRRFKTTPWMAAQVQEFQELATQLANAGCIVTVHGDGLLPHVARLMSQTEIAA